MNANSLLQHNARDVIKVVVWACEYKAQASAQNQVAYDLSSAQYQRRSLGFSNHSVYGAAISGSLATLYVSYWSLPDNREKCRIIIENIGKFDVAQPYGAIQYFNFVRSVIMYNASLLKDLETITSDTLLWAKNQYHGQGSWQARHYPINPPNPPKKGKKDQSGGDNSRAQEAGEVAFMDFVDELALMDLVGEVGEAEEMSLFDDGCKVKKELDLDAWERMGQRDTLPKEDVEAWRRKVETPVMLQLKANVHSF